MSDLWKSMLIAGKLLFNIERAFVILNTMGTVGHNVVNLKPNDKKLFTLNRRFN